MGDSAPGLFAVASGVRNARRKSKNIGRRGCPDSNSKQPWRGKDLTWTGIWPLFMVSPKLKVTREQDLAGTHGGQAIMAHLHQPRVLITDDEGSVRQYLSTVIRQSGMEAVEAPDGDAALLVLGKTSIDLLLLDVCMPGLDGFSVLREVRRRNKHLPVILLTGAGSVADAVKAM